MNSYISLIIIAVIGGITVALQGQFMGLIDKGIGTRESVFIPRNIEYWGRDRNAAHAALGGEFPTRTLSIVRRVPSSTITHVSASPPTIPDSRISRVRF